MHYLKYVLGWAITAALVACGGGGGSPGTTTGSSGAGSTPAAGTPTLVVELVDAAGVKTNFVSGSGVTARATVKDATGAVVGGKLVTFTGDATLIKFSPVSGQVLTDASGVASIQISPASLTAGGAGSLNVATTVGTTALSAAFDYQLSASNVALTALNVGTGALAAFGNRAISVIATINGVAAANTPIQVTFQASCGAINPATVTTDNTGKASATYSANNVACAGSNVSISASAPGATAVQSTIAVSGPQATNIEFVDATPQLIYLTGSVGASQSQLRFRVVDSAGTPLQNQSIQLSLVTNSGTGVSLNTIGNISPVTLTSDATGLVSVAVFSGTVPTSVQVRAVLVSNNAIAATSNVLTLASGRPVQRAASLSATRLAIEGFNVDGVETDITMALADRQGNPVPDGTQINFVAESGVMIPSSCVTSALTSSRCTVKIRTQGTRPTDGRVAVLAYVPGEEDFVDADFDNAFDTGEAFTDLGVAAYRDDNENGAYDTGEFTVPRAGASTCSGGTNGRLNTCDGSWGTVDVRAQINIVFSSSVGSISGTLTNTVVPGGTATQGTLTLRISDVNGNSMPAGSVIEQEVSSPTTSGCAATLPVTSIGNSTLALNFISSLAKCVRGDTITIRVRTPAAPVGTASVTTNTFAVP